MTDTHQALAQRDRPPLVVMRERLEARKDELAKALPSDISPDRFIRALTTSATITPDLQACSWQSLWTACMRACRDGLLPDGKEGAIVPYKSTATWIPMYYGKLKRVWQTGQFKWITAGIVREGEEFSHWIDQDGENFKHVPGDEINAKIIKVYAMATTISGGKFIEVIPIAEINKHRNVSRATREDAPWKAWPEAMMKKTALHQLMKMLPAGRDVFADEEEHAPEAPALAAVPVVPQPRGAAEVLERFADDSVPVEPNAPGEENVVWEDPAPVEGLEKAKKHER